MPGVKVCTHKNFVHEPLAQENWPGNHSIFCRLLVSKIITLTFLPLMFYSIMCYKSDCYFLEFVKNISYLNILLMALQNKPESFHVLLTTYEVLVNIFPFKIMSLGLKTFWFFPFLLSSFHPSIYWLIKQSIFHPSIQICGHLYFMPIFLHLTLYYLNLYFTPFKFVLIKKNLWQIYPRA